MPTSSGASAVSRVQGATVLGGVIAFGLGIAGLALQHVPGVGGFDLAYRSLQLFVLDGGALDGIDDPGPVLQVARFLAPIVTVMTLLLALPTAFRQGLRRRWVAATSGHAIVCGDTPEAHALARNLHHAGRTPVLLVSGTGVGVPADVPVVVGDPREPSTLRTAGIASAGTVYALTDSSAAGAAVAIAASKEPRRGRTPLRAYARVRSEDLIGGLRLRRLASAGPSRITVDFFTLTDVAADVLMTRHPPGTGTVVVLGTGELAGAVCHAIERRTGCPEPRRGPLEQAVDLCRGADDVVYVCADLDDPDEDPAVATALKLSTADGRAIVLCLRRRSPFADVVGDGGPVTVFGVYDESCRPGPIGDGTVLHRAARSIHEGYVRNARARGETVADNSSTAGWDELPEDLRRSNVAQADDIGLKLVEIGVGLTTEPVPDDLRFTDDEIEQLARHEHRRWYDDRTAAGYRYGPERTGRTHPDLVPWEKLTETAREKDRDAVRALPATLRAGGLSLVRDRPGAPDQ